MSRKLLVRPLVDMMKPKRRRGGIPKVTPCPYCGSSMSQTDLALHQPGCQQDFRKAPPQPADFMHDAGGGYNPDGTFPQT